MKNFISIKVPIDSDGYTINNVGCLRYNTCNGKLSSCIEPMEIGEYLENDKHRIIGTTILDAKKIVIIEQIT